MHAVEITNLNPTNRITRIAKQLLKITLSFDKSWSSGYMIEGLNLQDRYEEASWLFNSYTYQFVLTITIGDKIACCAKTAQQHRALQQADPAGAV